MKIWIFSGILWVYQSTNTSTSTAPTVLFLSERAYFSTDESCPSLSDLLLLGISNKTMVTKLKSLIWSLLYSNVLHSHQISDKEMGCSGLGCWRDVSIHIHCMLPIMSIWAKIQDQCLKTPCWIFTTKNWSSSKGKMHFKASST